MTGKYLFDRNDPDYDATTFSVLSTLLGGGVTQVDGAPFVSFSVAGDAAKSLTITASCDQCGWVHGCTGIWTTFQAPRPNCLDHLLRAITLSRYMQQLYSEVLVTQGQTAIYANNRLKAKLGLKPN